MTLRNAEYRCNPQNETFCRNHPGQVKALQTIQVCIRLPQHLQTLMIQQMFSVRANLYEIKNQPKRPYRQQSNQKKHSEL